jgi:hypothetical protein
MNIHGLFLITFGFLLGAAPQWVMAQSRDWDEILNTIMGGTGVGLAVLIRWAWMSYHKEEPK